METLLLKGFKPILDGSDLVGAISPDLAITLEPGAQFEISLNPQRTLNELEVKYLNFIELIDPLLEERDQKLYSSGYHPVSRIAEIPFIPKERYKFMSEYFRHKGDLALNMMKGTASIQVAIDFSSEEDFIRKMLLASKLTPIFGSVYDNSPVFEGQEYTDHSLRTLIWNNCDNRRCGIIPQVFEPDFSYEKYAEYILDQIPIFIVDQGNLRKYEKPFKTIFDPRKDAEKQLNHIFSMCFPDVRARSYIELRMTDSLPYPLNFAFIKLVETIFYNKDVFNSVSRLLKEITFYDVTSAKCSSIQRGVEAELGNEKLIDIFRKIVDIIEDIDSDEINLNKIIAEKSGIPEELHLREEA